MRVRLGFLTKIRLSKPAKIAIAVAVVVLVAIIALSVVLTQTDEKRSTEAGSQVVRDFQDRLPQLKSRAEDKPQDFSAQRGYAIALYATGDVEAAKKYYERALALKDDAVVSNNLGNAYRDLGDFQAAEKAYRQSIKLAPKTVNAYINLANIQLYSLDKSDEAIATYQAALKESPANAQLQILLATAYEQNGDVASAKQQLKKILTQEPENKAARSNLDRLEQ